jgi:hypothetical protein
MGPAEWILVIGAVGVFVIIAQRDYQRYKLQKAAVEKGLSLLPTGAPIWLASLKTGILVLALGIGLITMGSIGLANLPDPKNMRPPERQNEMQNKGPAPATRPDDTQPNAQVTQGQPQQFPGDNFQRPGGPGPGGPGPNGPPNGPGPGGPRLGRDGQPLPPHLQPGFVPQGQFDGPGPRDPRDLQRPVDGGGPKPNPIADAADARRVCHWAIGAGGVLAIVGFALTFFALFERKHVKPVSGDTAK